MLAISKRCISKAAYMPQNVRLLCPRQIGATTHHSEDGFNALSANPILTIQGQQTTINYDSLSKLSVLFTAPDISSYQRYLGALTAMKTDPTQPSSLLNLTKKQRQKLLHKCCVHEGFANLNLWIQQRKFPHIDPSLANEPDPICTTCQFGKASQETHNAHNGRALAWTVWKPVYPVESFPQKVQLLTRNTNSSLSG